MATQILSLIANPLTTHFNSDDLNTLQVLGIRSTPSKHSSLGLLKPNNPTR
jgi:hypothetical protein